MADGVVRPIDRSGRVVLPREYLRLIGLQEEESVFVSCQDGEIRLRRYMAFWNIPYTVKVMLRAFCHTYAQPLALCDQTAVRVANGISIAPHTECTPAMRAVISGTEQPVDQPFPRITADCDHPVRAVFPIHKGKELYGCLVLFQTVSELPLEGTRLLVSILSELVYSEC